MSPAVIGISRKAIASRVDPTVALNPLLLSSIFILESFGKITFATESTKTPTIIEYTVFAYSIAETPEPSRSLDAYLVFIAILIGCIHVLTMTGSISEIIFLSPSSFKFIYGL